MHLHCLSCALHICLSFTLTAFISFLLYSFFALSVSHCLYSTQILCLTCIGTASFALLLCASLALSLPSLRSYGVPFLHSHCPYGLLYFTLFLCYTLIVCIPCAFIVVKDSRWDEPRRAPFSPWGAAGAATGDEGESRCWPCHMGRSKIIYRSVKTGISFTSRLGKGAVGPDETRPALTGPSNKNGEVIPFHVCRGSE